MNLRNIFKKFKIKSKSFIVVTILTIIEIVLILWCNDWIFTPAIVPIFIQYIMIFEKRDVWDRLSEKEKKEIMIDEDDITKLIKGIEKLLDEGQTAEDIIKEIKDS